MPPKILTDTPWNSAVAESLPALRHCSRADELLIQGTSPMKARLFFLGAFLSVLTAGPAAFSAENAIVRENRNEGTTNWLLFNWDKVIAPGSDDLWKREKGVEGYCSQASIRAG